MKKKIRICVALKSGAILRGKSVKEHCRPMLENTVEDIYKAMAKIEKSLINGDRPMIHLNTVHCCFWFEEFAGVWVEEV